jgi:hypothetical protein
MVTMSQKEFQRVKVIKNAAGGRLSVREAARLLQLSERRLLFPLPNRGASGDNGIVRCKERLGGLLKYYEREAA